MGKMSIENVAAALVTLACSAVATDAAAGYFGLVTRAVCGSAGFVDTSASWALDPADGFCQMIWLGGATEGEAVYNQVVDRIGLSTTVTTTLSVYGSSDPALGQVCATSRTYTEAGTQLMASPTVCTLGATLIMQDIITQTLPLMQSGAANTVVTATSIPTPPLPATTIYKVSWTYFSNGVL